jgi:selenobiotic family peptide radical SAM maturase
MDESIKQPDIVFQRTKRILGERPWLLLQKRFSDRSADIPELIHEMLDELQAPAWLADLAKIESAIVFAGETEIPCPQTLDVNPALQVIPSEWKNLVAIIKGNAEKPPEPGNEMILVWRHPAGSDIEVRPASDDDLLALKMIVEGISSGDVAALGGIPVSAADASISRAIKQGLLISPPSKLARTGDGFIESERFPQDYMNAASFTLQWHITQACDLNCRHCYDRSERSPLGFEKALDILDQMYDFCRDRYVRGVISFTGGNPLLYPRFIDLYREARDRGFSIAILGNPAPKRIIEELLLIQMPDFIQVSLEGLEAHNDSIRGAGHFKSTMLFLKDMRALGVYTTVMLTLTSENIDQVIPLGMHLQDMTDNFTFNRLSLSGEGATLALPDRRGYRAFLEQYMDAAENYPVFGLKDSLINISRFRRGLPSFGGCTGYGCGAAFNFLALLPDGEAHACRKFPSLIGNINRQRLSGIYDSEAARSYRAGPSVCRDCPIRPGCGGCLASAYSFGLDLFKDKDPFCFFEES